MAEDDEEYVPIGDDEDEESGSDINETKLADDEFLQACLPVSGAPMPPSSEPPKDADEYLRQVQWERMQCPEVVEADVEERPMRRKNRGNKFGKGGSILASFGVVELPEETKPRPAWVEDATDAFEALRSHCQALRKEANGHQRLTFDGWRERVKSRPSTKFLSTQDFVSINHLIVVVVDEFVSAQDATETCPAESPAADVEDPFAQESGLLAEWAFAMLLFVEEPLFDDTQYQLQRLSRICKKALVAATDGEKQEPSVEGVSPAVSPDERRGRAALLLTIVQEVFGQR